MANAEFLPEELLAAYPEEWIRRVDTHQQKLAAENPLSLVDQPFPAPKNDEEKAYVRSAHEGIKALDETIEILLEEDSVLAALYRESVHIRQGYTETVRARRTVATYLIFQSIKDHTIAS